MTNEFAYGIRCIQTGSVEKALANRLSSELPNSRIAFLVDHMTGHIRPEFNDGLNCHQLISITREFLDAQGLYQAHPRIGWLCGDYALYAFADSVSADYYWLVEPDVAFTFERISDFFATLNSNDSDVLCLRFGKAASGWHWSPIISAYGYTAHCCNFPFIRFSRKAVEALRHARHDLSREIHDRPDLSWPNDESFTASVAADLGLSISRMEDLAPHAFDYFSTDIPLLDSQLPSIPIDQVVHPCLDVINFRRKVKSVVYGSLAGSRLRKSLVWLEQHGLSSDDFVAEAHKHFSAWMRESAHHTGETRATRNSNKDRD